jgi:myo-inositol catabolism protein IolH
MLLAVDPYMLRDRSLSEVFVATAELEYGAIELSPREDVLPEYARPRADRAKIREIAELRRRHGIDLASVMVLQRWSSPDPEERRVAVSFWRRAIEVAIELECRTINTEFSGLPERPGESEAAFWRSLEELLPIFESEGIAVHIEAHPGDFVELNKPAVDLVSTVDSDHFRYLYCAPHTFHLGRDVAEMIRYAAPLLAHVHVADSFDHLAGGGDRYIVNPSDSDVRVHQHNVVGNGEVDWDAFFGTLVDVEFDGIMTSCVLGWEDQALETMRITRDEIRRRLQTALDQRRQIA